MSEGPGELAAGGEEPQDLAAARPKRLEQLVEVCVFVFLILPSLVFSFFAAGGGGSFTIGGIAIILRDLALVSLILFFVWRNGEGLGQIGWRLRGRWRDVIWGLVLFVPMFYAAVWLSEALNSVGLTSPKSIPSSLSPHGAGEMVLASVMVVVVALAEETIFRGYLILRIQALTRSPAAAVLLSSVIFSLGHGYEGSAGVITVGFMGLVFAIIYLWRKSLITPIVMHFCQDFLIIVLLPLIFAKQ